MAICIIFTRSSPVSVLEKTEFLSLSILNGLSEKKKGISSAEGNPEFAEIPCYDFRATESIP